MSYHVYAKNEQGFEYHVDVGDKGAAWIETCRPGDKFSSTDIQVSTPYCVVERTIWSDNGEDLLTFTWERTDHPGVRDNLTFEYHVFLDALLRAKWKAHVEEEEEDK